MDTVLHIVAQSWRALLEIALLSVGLYFSFKFVRGTRGAPVVYGFVMLMLSLTVVAILLRLEVLIWLLRSFLTFGAVAVLIIFQPELRRILAELGTHPLLNAYREQRENIEIVIQAAERLAEVRIGALIAIQQTIHLKDVTESGLLIDC